MQVEYIVADSSNNDILNFFESLKTEEIIHKRSVLLGNKTLEVFIVNANDMRGARNLSDLNQKVIERVKDEVICIANESAEYYNKKLYPLFNEFERKLRKLLYLASVSNEDVEGVEKLKNLEKKKLQEIFEVVFVDPELKNKVVEYTNNGRYQYSKRELLQKINTLEENSLWGLIVENKESTIYNRYFDVRRMRNSVMHAHNISHETFMEMKTLLRIVNKEIDEKVDSFIEDKTIDKIASAKHSIVMPKEKSEKYDAINQMLTGRLVGMELENKRLGEVLGAGSQIESMISSNKDWGKIIGASLQIDSMLSKNKGLGEVLGAGSQMTELLAKNKELGEVLGAGSQIDSMLSKNKDLEKILGASSQIADIFSKNKGLEQAIKGAIRLADMASLIDNSSRINVIDDTNDDDSENE